MVLLNVQSLLSVMITVYSPEANPVNVAKDAPLSQSKLYGDVPPETFKLIAPFDRLSEANV